MDLLIASTIPSREFLPSAIGTVNVCPKPKPSSRVMLPAVKAARSLVLLAAKTVDNCFVISVLCDGRLNVGLWAVPVPPLSPDISTV